MAVSSDAIRALVEPALISSGLELWDVEVSHDAVRVLVDRPGGIDLDALAELAAKVVSPLLDDHPELTPPGAFSLEVSSPGLERNLTRVEHFARYLGAEVSVKTSEPVSGSRRHHGILMAADEHGIRISPKDGSAGAVLDFDYARIERARTVLVWGSSEKPGKGRSKGPSKAVKRPAADDSAASDGRTIEVPVASNDAKDTAQ